jgi:stage II sporulation protein D
MNIETAVASVVAAESLPSTPLEAMKAQAVAARSFFHAGGHHGDDEFCDTTHCQFLRQPPPSSSRAFAAARDTRGLVLTWRGEPLAAMYSSRCGGTTKTLQQIGSPVRGYPYFAVECAYCRRHPYTWTRSLSAADARRLSPSTGQQPGERARLAVDRVHGWSAIPSDDYRAIPGSDMTTLQGKGQGHGLGLCQYGAAGMAAAGADFAAILRHYYPETELATIPNQAAPR